MDEKKSSIGEALKTLQDGVKNFAKALASALDVCYELFKAYPNERVRNKAFYHPRKKVRERNLKRITKWMARQYKKQQRLEQKEDGRKKNVHTENN